MCRKQPEDVFTKTFRAGDLLAKGEASLDYRHATSYLPREEALYAQARDSDDAYFQHRCKSGLKLDWLASNDIELLAGLLGVTTGRLRKFINDNTGSEHLGGGTMHWFRRAFRRFSIPPGNEVVADAAIIRGPRLACGGR